MEQATLQSLRQQYLDLLTHGANLTQLCGMDHAQMAKRLHVHKNTVVYRLQRIADLFAPDLKDCRVLTDLYLSLFADFQP